MAGQMTETELPLRIMERDGNPIIKCLCGAEVAAVRSHLLEVSFSPAALLRMILHARGCRKGQAIMHGQQVLA